MVSHLDINSRFQYAKWVLDDLILTCSNYDQIYNKFKILLTILTYLLISKQIFKVLSNWCILIKIVFINLFDLFQLRNNRKKLKIEKLIKYNEKRIIEIDINFYKK